MNNLDLAPISQRLSEIEEQIEELFVAVNRFRKAMTLSKVAIVCGCSTTLGAFSGLVGFGRTSFVFGIAAFIGGIVSLGSNRSTLLETQARIQSLEKVRSTLIDELPMRTFGDENSDSGSGSA